MSRLKDLLRELGSREPALARDVEREVTALMERRAFGLNFERHVPEAVELPGRRVRKGDKVRVLPRRGQIPKKPDEKLWRVIGIDRSAGAATLETEPLQSLDAGGRSPGESKGQLEARTASLDDLVVVAEFRDPIYPGLVSTGQIQRGGDKPFHTVVNAENYYALETLLFAHRGSVDCIYIDPPYNGGARDWKYNNDYVEKDDLYRHSKWLAMMERRLLLAKELLNPADSVLIVTIDEKEYLRLGLLLEQLFPEARTQMISSVINPKGSARGKEFYRVDEYIFFLTFGRAVVQDFLIPGLCITKADEGEDEQKQDTRSQLPEVRWASLLRSGSGAQREESHLKFYPIFVDVKKGRILGCGEPLPLGEHPRSVDPQSDDIRACYPMRQDGSEGRWQLNVDSFRALLKDGHIKIGSIGDGKITFYYLMDGQRRKLERGDLVVTGRDKYGGIIVEYARVESISGRPKTQWAAKSHSATDHGTSMLRKLIPGRTFPFPKSLYAVEDALRFFILSKPNALVIDFFAGSGTTAHAVMRLNKQDDGRRRSICVTNNEVAADEQKALRAKGFRPGDPEWERWGICEFITKPRIKAAVTGKTPDGTPIQGDYKFTDEFPMADGFEENVEFLSLTYEAPLSVASNREFAKVAPLLWLRAGACGRRIGDISCGWDVADTYGVLADLDYTEKFRNAIAANEKVRVAYVVTDEDRLFESVAKELPAHVEPVRLYEAYLRNFEVESGRSSL